MWELLLEYMGQRRVAVCIPWKGEPVALIYWYGVLASIGIALGAFYASKHMQSEGDDPDTVWDALLWVLIPALLGARLWYVAQAAIGGSTSKSRDMAGLLPMISRKLCLSCSRFFSASSCRRSEKVSTPPMISPAGSRSTAAETWIGMRSPPASTM